MLMRTATTGLRAPLADGDRAVLARIVICCLAATLAVTAILSLGWGASDASAFEVVMHWVGLGDGTLAPRDRLIVETIRLPRVTLGGLVGAGLAVAGAILQGLFRNPLADPALIGVTAGAGLCAVSMIVLGGTVLAAVAGLLGIYALPVAAFIGGLAASFALYRIATRRGQTSVATMLLAGIALTAFANAIMGVLIFIASDAQLRDLIFWGLGSLAGATTTKVMATAPIILVSLAATPFLARSLNALALGEAAANHLGIPVQRMKSVALVCVAALTGASVAVSGGIGFVGIVVPHLLRLVIGPDHRYLLPASALLGGTFLIAADAISRTVVAPAELPIGIITALVGAPFFIWVLLRRRGLIDL
ncbi:MAG: iron ABC transporter permease [Rhodobiaceae bacterium]|nr:iron ABC transporter permease [Rhodobiaceae bacterium]MCC0056154.1 iron ABC transporter permease [Rhodobiaceae bacterium]